MIQPITGCRAVGCCKADFLPAARIQQSFRQIRGAAVGQHCLHKSPTAVVPGIAADHLPGVPNARPDRAALAPHRQLVAQLFPKGAPLRGRVCNFYRAHRPLLSPLLQIRTISLLPWYTKRSKIASPCGSYIAAVFRIIKNAGRCGQKKKADLKRNRLLAKDCNLDGICARGRCAVLTRYSPLKNCDIMEVLYSNIPSAMR